MTTPVLLAVLGAAFLHALWNAMIRVGADRVGTMLVLSVVQGLIGLAIALMLPMPKAEAIPWFLASGLIHTAYKTFLAFAYEHGDLSRVYPIARGAAPLIVLLVGVGFLGETLASSEAIGILILGAGILFLARGIWTSGENRRLLPFALGSAAATAGYTLVDGLGARVAGDAAAYVGWLFIVDGAVFALVMTALRGRSAIPRQARVWLWGGLASLISYFSYWVAVWAMTFAPIPLVAALRETSILFAVLTGWLLMGEAMRPAKALAIGMIAAGVAVTRLGS